MTAQRVVEEVADESANQIPNGTLPQETSSVDESRVNVGLGRQETTASNSTAVSQAANEQVKLQVAITLPREFNFLDSVS